MAKVIGHPTVDGTSHLRLRDPLKFPYWLLAVTMLVAWGANGLLQGDQEEPRRSEVLRNACAQTMLHLGDQDLSRQGLARHDNSIATSCAHDLRFTAITLDQWSCLQNNVRSGLSFRDARSVCSR